MHGHCSAGQLPTTLQWPPNLHHSLQNIFQLRAAFLIRFIRHLLGAVQIVECEDRIDHVLGRFKFILLIISSSVFVVDTRLRSR